MTQSQPAPPLDIAILLNSYRSPVIEEVRQSYVRTIGAISPKSRLSFFYPVERDELPDPEDFDLIVLGGSNVDPRNSHQTILHVHQFVRKLTTDYPHKKLCGICWGHQTISLVFGGEVVDMVIPEIGVTEVRLTPLGRLFFGAAAGPDQKSILRIQQHHRREVSVKPIGFIKLSEDNQCFINEKGTILTFQGHPEKDADTAKLRIHDIERWFNLNVRDQSIVADVIRRMELEDDGAMIWRRIFQWAGKGQNAVPMPVRVP